MKDNPNLKGWLVLPEGMVDARLVVGFNDYPEHKTGNIISPASVIVHWGKDRSIQSYVPYVEVKALFEKALAESKESN